MRRILALVFISLAFAGCARSPTNSSLLTTTLWNLVSLNGQPLITGSKITLAFIDNDMHGQVSCNSYGGPVSVDDQQIKVVGVFQVTLVGCVPGELNAQSETYINTLTARYPIDYRLVEGGSQLEILNAKGEAVLLYDAVPPSSITPTLMPQGVPRPDQ